MPPITEERALWLARNVLPHEPALRGWLKRRSVQGLEIDDVVQETYATLVELEAVAHIQNPRTYVFSVAQSIVLQHLRRRRIVQIDSVAEMDRLDIYSDEAGPEQRAAAHQELHEIARLIANLPAKCREAFTLRKVHGLSQRQVAERMSVSENTIEKHIVKALRVLTLGMGRDEGGGQGSFPASPRKMRHGEVNDDD